MSAGSNSPDCEGSEDGGVLIPLEIGVLGWSELGVLGFSETGVFGDGSFEVGVFGFGFWDSIEVFRRDNRVDEYECCCCCIDRALVVGIRRSETDRRIGFGDGSGEWWTTDRRGFVESGVLVDIGIFEGELDLKNLWTIGVVAVVGWWLMLRSGSVFGGMAERFIGGELTNFFDVVAFAVVGLGGSIISTFVSSSSCWST